MLQIEEAAAREEIALHVLDPRLDLSLGLWPIRRAETGRKTVITGEIGKGLMQNRCAVVPADDYGLWIVIEQFFGGSSEPGERLLMGSKQGRQLLIQVCAGKEPA